MQPRQRDEAGSADPHFNKMPSDGIVYERFWTTANQEYGRWVDNRKPPPPSAPTHHMSSLQDPTTTVTHSALQQPYDPRNLPPPPPPPQMASQAAFTAGQMTQRAPPPGTCEPGVVDVTQHHLPDTSNNFNYSNNIESRTDASYQETAPQEVAQQRTPKRYTDEELTKEVDFLGRAAKMASSGESGAKFPPSTPAEQYMERVQTRFWNAMQ